MSIDSLSRQLPSVPAQTRPSTHGEGNVQEQTAPLTDQQRANKQMALSNEMAQLAALLNAPMTGPNSSLVASLTPPGNTTAPAPKQVDTVAGNPSEAAAKGGVSIGSMEQISTDIGSFMALFQQLAQSMRSSARIERTAEMQSQVSALTNAADQMKAAAGLRLAAGIAQGAMQIAGGIVQVGAGAVSMGTSIAGAGATMKGQNANIGGKTEIGNALIAQGSKLGAIAGMANSFAGASSSIAGGVGGSISAGINYAAEMKEVQKTKLEVEAKVHETAVQHANEVMQTMQDVIRDIREKVQSMNQAAVETNKSIARNI